MTSRRRACPGRDPEVLRRLGRRLRGSLSSTEWPRLEAEILEVVKRKQPVAVTIRSAAAELYFLSWELLTIEATGQHLGELPDLLLRYEWPDTETIPERRLPSFPGCRVLLAWSGQVPADRRQIRRPSRMRAMPARAPRRAGCQTSGSS